MAFTVLTFIGFTVLVAVISWWKTRDDDLSTKEGYFLAGRGLPGIVIAGSLMMTNLSAEQLVGTNGQSFAGNMSTDRTGFRIPAKAPERRHRHHPRIFRDALRYLYHAAVFAAVPGCVCCDHAADYPVFWRGCAGGYF